MSKFVTPVSGAEIYIFAGAFLNAKRLGKVFHGDALQVLDTVDSFYKINHGILTGWIPSWMTQQIITAPPPKPTLRLAWPTEYKVITQGFNLHPEWYNKFGLPGHEGLDIRAPMNSKIFAAADGKVFAVETDPTKHNYGKHIRISHQEGYTTVYAHLAEVKVQVDQTVRKGEIIGLANSTGNSSGSHLHFTLKKKDATKNGETEFPYDIIDPTPFFDL